MKGDWFITAFLLFFIGMFFVAGIATGSKYTTEAWEMDCVKRGVARWVVSDTGRTSFQWNEPEPTP